jgi:hypothetical protein
MNKVCNNNKENYVIKTIAMTKFLTDRGFEIVGTLPNIFIPNKIVWLFKNTPELRQAMSEYKGLEN